MNTRSEDARDDTQGHQLKYDKDLNMYYTGSREEAVERRVLDHRAWAGAYCGQAGVEADIGQLRLRLVLDEVWLRYTASVGNEGEGFTDCAIDFVEQMNADFGADPREARKLLEELEESEIIWVHDGDMGHWKSEGEFVQEPGPSPWEDRGAVSIEVHDPEVVAKTLRRWGSPHAEKAPAA